MDLACETSGGTKSVPFALGTSTWGDRVTGEVAEVMFHRYLSVGGTVVDTAHSYGGGLSERMIGSILSSGQHPEVKVMTKAGVLPASDRQDFEFSTQGLLRQLETSLGRLGRSQVDVWYLHVWPHTEAEQSSSWAAAAEAYDAGLIGGVGFSNFDGLQIAKAYRRLALQLGVPVLAVQNQCSVLWPSPLHDSFAVATRLSLQCYGWSTLGGGLIPALSRSYPVRYDGGSSAEAREREIVGLLNRVALSLGITAGQLSIAWLAQANELAVRPILGPRNVGQLDESMASLAVEIPAAANNRISRLVLSGELGEQT